MTHPPLAADHIDAPHREVALGDLALEAGATIVDYRQSFVVHGELNAAGTNAVLVCPALTATHHRLDFLIGAGKALDPARWCIVVADPIGNGLSTSPSNSSAQPGMRFPRFVLRDMVEAQRRLLVVLERDDEQIGRNEHCGLGVRDADGRVETLSDKVHHRIAQVKIDRDLRIAGQEFRQQGRDVQ